MDAAGQLAQLPDGGAGVGQRPADALAGGARIVPALLGKLQLDEHGDQPLLLSCLLLLAIALWWHRSKWIWAVPAVPLALFLVMPDAVSSRAAKFVDLSYYSNAERLQMLRVGWKMLQDHPLTGVGPGRVDELYESYLDPGDPVPAYHGHLHNNLAQIAAQFGVPGAFAALAFAICAFLDLLRAKRAAANPDTRFLTDTALLAFIGFVVAGLFEYTYGHSLGLIMIAFAVLPALWHSSLTIFLHKRDWIVTCRLRSDWYSSGRETPHGRSSCSFLHLRALKRRRRLGCWLWPRLC